MVNTINNEKLADVLNMIGYPLMADHARIEKDSKMLLGYVAFLRKNTNKIGKSILKGVCHD